MSLFIVANFLLPDEMHSTKESSECNFSGLSTHSQRAMDIKTFTQQKPKISYEIVCSMFLFYCSLKVLNHLKS